MEEENAVSTMSSGGRRQNVVKLWFQPFAHSQGFHGVMASTLDSESSDPSSSLGGTFLGVRGTDSLHAGLKLLQEKMFAVKPA